MPYGARCFALPQIKRFYYIKTAGVLPALKKGAACCCDCMLQEREMQENLNDNCLALCDNAWVFYFLAAPGIFVGADVCAISHDKHQKFFRSCLIDTSFSHIPGLFSALIRSIFSSIIFSKVLSSSSTLFSAATDLSANASKHTFFI